MGDLPDLTPRKADSSVPVGVQNKAGAAIDIPPEMGQLGDVTKLVTAGATQAVGAELGGIAGLFAAIDNLQKHGSVEKDTVVAMAVAPVVGNVVQNLSESGPATTAQGVVAPEVSQGRNT
jgi:hypothetical protein